MRVTFYARQYIDLVVELAAEEQTGTVLPTYFESYFGHEGSVTLRHMQTNQTFAIGLYTIGHNVFEGVYPLAELPFGLYQLEGRVRDQMYNYAVLSAFHIDTGLPLQLLEMMLEVGYNVVPVINISGKFKMQLDNTAAYGILINVAGKRATEIPATGRYDSMVEVKGQYNEVRSYNV